MYDEPLHKHAKPVVDCYVILHNLRMIGSLIAGSLGLGWGRFIPGGSSTDGKWYAGLRRGRSVLNTDRHPSDVRRASSNDHFRLQRYFSHATAVG
ncbi:hypothetical protein [Paraburkholderia hospita]|uniref:hypothetical protein n=1 Tax=Paraburkholderia hospita TaxID=169430 RepID=UPI000B34786A|nr:hypothetical protein [Paraburkholderia hospita]OUL70029.1 hypothetical protein CA603_49900 [Paraburkholderia hospita]OUL79513.1 hypothetical protein CA601_34610 [Paraburkholderia hospita]